MLVHGSSSDVWVASKPNLRAYTSANDCVNAEHSANPFLTGRMVIIAPNVLVPKFEVQIELSSATTP